MREQSASFVAVVSSADIGSLTSQKGQMHKQLQHMLTLERQLDSDLRDTQQVVAQELLQLQQQIKVSHWHRPVVSLAPPRL